jgi:hypothetical protein
VGILTIDIGGAPPLARMLQRSTHKRRRCLMFSPVMNWMDRVTMTVAVVLAAVPVLALAANSLIA